MHTSHWDAPSRLFDWWVSASSHAWAGSWLTDGSDSTWNQENQENQESLRDIQLVSSSRASGERSRRLGSTLLTMGYMSSLPWRRFTAAPHFVAEINHHPLPGSVFLVWVEALRSLTGNMRWLQWPASLCSTDAFGFFFSFQLLLWLLFYFFGELKVAVRFKKDRFRSSRRAKSNDTRCLRHRRASRGNADRSPQSHDLWKV